jgi:hypothetical protein
LALVAGLLVNLSEKGLFAIKPPFDSGFRSAVEGSDLRLRVDTGLISAALELEVEIDGPQSLSASLVDSGQAGGPLGVHVMPDGAHSKVLVYKPEGSGVSDKFPWPPGAAVALRSPSQKPPQLLAWTLYSDEHPTDSSDAVEMRRTSRLWLLGWLVAGGVAGVLLLYAGFKKESDAGPPTDLKVFIIQQILLRIEHQQQPETARLGRAILASVLLENMSRADAINRHSPDATAGRAAFFWARQVFLNTMTQTISDLQSTYLSKLRRS